MSEVLTMAEMEERFPDEWVLILDPDTGSDLKVRSGIVEFHSKDRDAVHDRAVALRPARFALLFLGEAKAPTMFAVL
jgi:hypothetical protein